MLKYTIHLAAISFLRQEPYKVRPVVVLTEPAGEYQTVLVAPIYSQQIKSLLPSDIALSNYAGYGLVRFSTVRLHRITEMLLSELKEQLGAVPEEDQSKLQAALKITFQLS